jgi:hypothetical protein
MNGQPHKTPAVKKTFSFWMGLFDWFWDVLSYLGTHNNDNVNLSSETLRLDEQKCQNSLFGIG